MSEMAIRDYSLTGINGKNAVASGLADAIWYTCPVPKEAMRKLLVRKDGPGIRDTLIWFGILFSSGYLGFVLWGSWWAIIPFAIYGVFYASSSDSRWHETSHGTVFKTDRMNEALYEVASFMRVRESVPWRWSHTRHHTDTLIVGRDPEIAIPRPANLCKLFFSVFGLTAVPAEFRKMIIHAGGELTDEEKGYVPASEWQKVYVRARIYLAIYAFVFALAIYSQSWLPLMYVVFPHVYGGWLGKIHGLSQHTGLAENVTDHRLNCRTVHMNLINRFIYWNMNYHIEHHMFPLVPYHALPKLHELIKDDCPKAHASNWDVWQEIIPALWKQSKDSTYFVPRELPTPSVDRQQHIAEKTIAAEHAADEEGWILVCDDNRLGQEDVIRFDHADQTFAIYRTAANTLYATDGICTHGNAHLADGMIKDHLIECPKHNGRFDIRDGSPQRSPVCVALKTYDVEEREGQLYLGLNSAHGVGAEFQQSYEFRVVSNENVATYIKELILKPETITPVFSFKPGDYVQLDIPALKMTLEGVEIQPPYDKEWRERQAFHYEAENGAPTRRNYSIASNPAVDEYVRFNVRIAMPPEGQLCKAGTGSSYVFNLKAGDKVSAVGPFGDFCIKDSDNEMIYLGGGAGMAPIRAHLSHLLETQSSKRKISFWYGARSEQEMFYQEYFEALAQQHENFSFHFAYSDVKKDGSTAPYAGFIHDVLKNEYLDSHTNPAAVEYYLCGPPAMMQAAIGMLGEFKVDSGKISYDEF